MDEEALVEMWRIDQYGRMGFDGLQIATLLHWNVDAGDVRDLMDSGCTHALAMRILRPLDADSHEEIAAEAITVTV